MTPHHGAAYVVGGLALFGAALASYPNLSEKHQPVSSSALQQEVSPPLVAGEDGYSRGNTSLPSFDLVRVEPNGDAVIAGRAAPGAAITALRNGQPYGAGLADASGSFVLVLQQLPVGASEIVLRSMGADGLSVYSTAMVTTAIAQSRSARPVVELTSAFKSTVILSAAAALAAGPQELDRKAPDASTVMHIASDDVQAEAGIFASVTGPKIHTAVISRGDSLWTISGRTYGRGAQYARVFGANREIVHDPNKIYPKQVLVIPAP
jgi:hypothetical protein